MLAVWLLSGRTRLLILTRSYRCTHVSGQAVLCRPWTPSLQMPTPEPANMLLVQKEMPSTALAFI